MVSLGSFLINRSTTLIVGIVCPIVTAGQFVLSMQVFFALMAISNILLSIKIPEISQAVAKREHYTVKILIYKVVAFSSSIYLLGFVTFFNLGRICTSYDRSEFIISPTRLPSHSWINLFFRNESLHLRHNNNQ